MAEIVRREGFLALLYAVARKPPPLLLVFWEGERWQESRALLRKKGEGGVIRIAAALGGWVNVFLPYCCNQSYVYIHVFAKGGEMAAGLPADAPWRVPTAWLMELPGAAMGISPWRGLPVFFEHVIIAHVIRIIKLSHGKC